ncbi:hypothetical protein TRIUR3_13467 [Triticum urartu]|uniref:Uncharacterized protein n=1 Tax=Triticum urartu TaxID=4572 RepID=M7YPC1_TRIUA|nr:hypothetical protein TRIUR3_13467 [Triticum urartu]
MTSLLRDLGANPTVVELDEDPWGKDMEKALARLIGGNPAAPGGCGLGLVRARAL